MRIPCKRRADNAPRLLIAVDGDYAHVVDEQGLIWHVMSNTLQVNMAQCFSRSITAAVKP